MKAQSTIYRELRRVVQAKGDAAKTADLERLDWLYGAESALAWVLGGRYETMAPSRAFAREEP